jgi:hypothetical protein
MTPRWRLGLMGGALVGCADVLDIPDDPELVDSGPWRCLGQPGPAPAPASDSARVQVAACDFESESCATPVTGLRARLCPSNVDVDCAEPLSVDIVDEGGLLSFSVPTSAEGFDGYLEVESATEMCTTPSLGDQGAVLCGLLPECDPAAPSPACEVPLYARALLFFNPPIFNDTTRPIPLPLLPSAAMPALSAAAHESPLDRTAGNLFITALDCDGEPAAGVTYRIDRDEDRAARLYLAQGNPTDAASRTDGSGLGGFVGVPPGIVGVQGSIDGSSTVDTGESVAVEGMAVGYEASGYEAARYEAARYEAARYDRTGYTTARVAIGTLETFTQPLTMSYAFLSPATPRPQ